MEHSHVYEFGDIILQPLYNTDIENLRVLRNKEKEYFTTQNEITREMQKEWYKKYLKKNDDIMFRIVKKADPERFIGAIALYDIDWQNKICEFGRIMVDKGLAPEKGIGLQAAKAVCLFGFEELKMEKIICVVLKTNARVIKVYDRAGFHIVGENDNLYNMEITYSDLMDAEYKMRNT